MEATVVLPPADEIYHASESDLLAVRGAAERHGITVEWSHREARTVRVSGERDQLERFATAAWPAVAILGLNSDPVAKPHIRPLATAPAALTALQVAKAYNFPDSDGAGQRIAIIELGGGFGSADLATYFGQNGLKVPTVNSIPVAGGQNQSDGPNGADGEVLLDIEVAGAIAPGAIFDVYFGPNTDQGFLSAINGAIHGGASIISISWGGPESSWSKSVMTAYDQAFAQARTAGIPVFCAAGDNGSGDGASGQNADFPASSPNVIACGGTRLTIDSAGALANETVWNDNPQSSASGGGYSTLFPKPGYQSSVVPGSHRGLPDISGNADPNSGYRVYVDGSWMVVGGTSAVAPLLAGLAARLNHLESSRGWLNDEAYAHPEAFRDVTSGSNGDYRAGPGWDPASGLGSPDGSKLLAAIGGPAPTPPPATPPPTPVPVPPAPGGDGCFHLCGFTDNERVVIARRAAHAYPNDAPETAQVKWLESRIRAAFR